MIFGVKIGLLDFEPPGLEVDHLKKNYLKIKKKTLASLTSGLNKRRIILLTVLLCFSVCRASHC